MDYFVHESSYVDEGARIGAGTKIWHFCHVLSGAVIGERCSFGQNCSIAGGTVIGNNVKAQNNISIYEDSSKANEIMRGETQTGSGEIDYDVDALDAGQYYFDCIIHPADMNGTLYVV